MALLKLRPLFYRLHSHCYGCKSQKHWWKEISAANNIQCTNCKSYYAWDEERGLVATSGPALLQRLKRLFLGLIGAQLLVFLFTQVFQNKDLLILPVLLLLYGLLMLSYHAFLYYALRENFVEFVPTSLRPDPTFQNMQSLLIFAPVGFYWFYTLISLFYGVESML